MSLATRNVEPIAGYTLRERIGSGGYGEVWKADAPGGLAKAIKLVYGYADGDRGARELKAMGLIKTLRHPFLLSLERIEVIDGQLIIVTELADCSLKDQFERRRAEGLRGIPRPELLQFMRDAADALDYMNEQHSLQHLDVKPENLLLVGDHVKVADFGLVKDVQKQTASMLGGLTPVYASPELFSGTASRRSDQYSLAIVYQEMLTGVLPFPGKSAAQLAAQHINAKPLLFSLPPGERKVIARALAKEPAQRFATCRELVEHLQNEVLQAALPAAESWFGKIGAPREDAVEPVTSTMCLNTARFGATAAAAAALPVKEPVAPPPQDAGPSYEVSHEEIRSSADMFADMEEATERVEGEYGATTEFSATFVMRKAREPRITMAEAPPVKECQSLRPTLVLGIGRVGGIVLQRLKQRMADRLGKAEACPSLQFLFLDADPQGVQATARGDEGAPLDPQEVMLLGLRKSQEYRTEGPALLQWLSRRWLFNIPRSQTPEGLRPLGRLAYADHAKNVRDRIRKSLQKSMSEEACQQSQTACGLPFAGPPRVIVLGAACGGTAGGMMLDVCFLTRQLLERLGNPERDVLGIMMHYRGRQSASHELALVNSYATLAELDYYSRPEKPFPGDPSCLLEPRKEDHAPMRDGYFVHLGDFLSDADLAASADRVAEYVYLDCLTSASSFFNACRETPPQPAKSRSMSLRTFGLTQVGFSSGELVPWASLSLCADLFQRWLGEGVKKNSEAEAALEQETQEGFKSRGLEFESLLQNLLGQVEGALPENSQDCFRAALLPDGKPLTATVLAALDFNVVLHRVSEVLAQRGEEALGLESKYPDPIKGVAALVEAQAKKHAQDITAWVLSRGDAPGYRLLKAEKVAALVAKQLSSFHDEARNQRKKLQEGLIQLETLLGAGVTPTGTRLSPIRKSPQEYEARYQEYMRLRLYNVALFFLQEWARRVKNLVVPTYDQLVDARRDLKGLFAQMSPGVLRESPSPGADAELRKALVQEFATYRADLVQQLDDALQSGAFQSGFLQVLARGGEFRLQLVDQLFHLSRAALMRSLQGLDIANFLLEPGRNRLPAALDAAQPKALSDAVSRTLVAYCDSAGGGRSELLAASVKAHCGAQPAVISYRESDVAIVYELSELPIAEVALRLIDERSDFIEYARRVFSRGDIPFEPLALKEEDEE